jgi:hypothetical protein
MDRTGRFQSLTHRHWLQVQVERPGLRAAVPRSFALSVTFWYVQYIPFVCLFYLISLDFCDILCMLFGCYVV